MPLINKSALRKLIHSHGKRLSPLAGKMFEAKANELAQALAGVHNGGKKTIDATVAAFILTPRP